MIDRYAAYDMPLGWLLPNDGYGAGYGQEETLDGNIRNLKSLGDYARGKGVEIGLWTQSDLHPKPEVSALLQRDIVKEVRDAGVRVLKTDVAWVGAGYSFGLNGIADVAQIMPYYGGDARPFIISLDGGPARALCRCVDRRPDGRRVGVHTFPHPDIYRFGLSGQPNITSTCGHLREAATLRSIRETSSGRPSRRWSSTWTGGARTKSIPMLWASLPPRSIAGI